MTLSCDVLVVGGGPAGIAAALCAAEAGARTRLLEAAPRLGGNVSQAFVHTICGLHLGDARATPANPGFPLRFYEGLRSRRAAGAPERVGRVWVVPIEPLGLAEHAAACVRDQAGLACDTGCTLIGARLARDVDGESVLRVRRSGAAGGEEEIVARTVVDASGDGVLGSIAGADHDRASAGALQACSYIVRLGGVPADATEGFGRMTLSVAITQACRAGALPEGCESILIRPAGAPGEAFVTLGLAPLEGEAYDPLDAGYRLRALEVARQRADRIVAHLRAHRSGFADCAIVGAPERIGVREGRRLLGRAVLSRDAVLEGRRGADGVALSSWPIELWDDYRRARLQYPEGACSVPLGALASRSHVGLAMAGRCVSASHEALGALRVIGTALATGAAAGRAAALAADARCAIGDVDPARVREAALGSGAALAPEVGSSGAKGTDG